MPENKVQITLEAVNNTKKALNEAQSGLQGMISTFKGNWMQITAASAAIYGAVKTIQAFAQAASEAEQIESRMAFQLGQVGYSFGAVKPLVDEFAESIMRTTRFSDEMARKGIGQMMQYTTDLNQAMQGTKLAMDISTQSGMDLESTIRYVGMAINGNAEILGRWIPELRDLEQKLGANATAAEKAAYAIDVLNKKFGSAAEKDVETYAGKVEQLKNQYDELKETVGKEIVVPVLKNWMDWIQLAGDGIIGLKKKVTDFLLSEGGISPRELEGRRLKMLAGLEEDAKAQARILAAAKKEAEDEARKKALAPEIGKAAEEYRMKTMALMGDSLGALEARHRIELQTIWDKYKNTIDVYKLLDAAEEFQHREKLAHIKEQEIEEKQKADQIRSYNLKLRGDAISAMQNLGIKTEAAASSEITAVIAQFKKITDSGFFSREQLDEAKTRVIEKLREIQAAYTDTMGRWEEVSVPVGKELAPSGTHYRTKWETEWRWIETGTSQLTQNVESMVGRAIKELDALERATDHPYRILIETDSIDEATLRLNYFEDRLREIVERAWRVQVYITGIGSSEKPIMEKISEIWNAFETMGSEIGNMSLTMNLSQIRSQMERISAGLAREPMSSPYGFSSPGLTESWERNKASRYNQISELQAQYNQISGINFGAAASRGNVGGGGETGVSISINTINIIGGSDMEIAEKLDSNLAELWEKNRSRLKLAIGQS